MQRKQQPFVIRLGAQFLQETVAGWVGTEFPHRIVKSLLFASRGLATKISELGGHRVPEAFESGRICGGVQRIEAVEIVECERPFLAVDR